MNILALNSGSSSFKFGLYRVDLQGVQTLLSETVDGAAHADVIARVTEALARPGLPVPEAIGHRIVHGGPALRQHAVIDAAGLQQLEAASTFAPLHMPAALALIGFAQQRFPGVPQVACFDTCFHAGMPEVARRLPIARHLHAEGLQRYGFHGLSLESIVRQLGAHVPQRMVIAHLGNGASVTAVKAGRSIDTSMGLTPTGGAIMGTRSGDLDPGVLLHLLREKHFDPAALQALVDHGSGLLGISGVSSDMRQLHEAATANADAGLAIQMFCQSVRKHIAAMIAVLGGIDRLVFTGGIGENDAMVRDEVCSGLAWAGIDASAGSGSVQVLASQEDEEIARHTWALVAA